MWKEALKQRLDNYHQAGLYRSRWPLNAAQGVKTVCEQKACVNFCSNDYLNLANHPDLIQALKQGADHYGVGSGASHMVSGHSEIHSEVETAFAKFLKRERAILFSNGYMANLGVLDALLTKDDAVFSDKYCHASILDGIRLSDAQHYRYRHLDSAHLKRRLRDYKADKKLIVSDAVFSMQGDIANADELANLALRNNALLMLDDAHGIGVLGENGGGICEHYELDAKAVPILVCPLGKAFGVAGAVVAGSYELIESLLQFARSYIYHTAMPPAIAAAILASLNLVKTEAWRRVQLRKVIEYFRTQALQLGLNLSDSVTPIQTILVPDSELAMQLADYLKQRGFLLRVMRPPTVPSQQTCLRVTLSCEHQPKQIDALLTTLREAYESLSE
ncbi:MAG: 8-amino-7-oxononanoate synthase [Gammaproteobacteria bacterium]|nr:8-amino-7-oxononanoate synthase [Gammaproteobacteria bacterium]